MTAAQRLAALDELPAPDLLGFTEGALRALVEVMNKETVLLRAGRHREAGPLGAEKARLAQDYVGYARAVQRQAERLRRELPDGVGRLRLGHERLATQIGENLKVLAVARGVTEDIFADVADAVARSAGPRTYGTAGKLMQHKVEGRGLSLNRAL